jgi:splicing factor 3B subunit 3
LEISQFILIPVLQQFDTVSLHSFLYQFQKLGDDDDEPEFSSTSFPSLGMADPTIPLPRAYFRPHPLDNLVIADELESLDPILDSKILNILPNSDTPQIFTACGRGARSTLRTLRHGLEVEESVSSDLPGIPNAVWTTKLKEDGKFCTRCITSFTNMSQMPLILTSFSLS